MFFSKKNIQLDAIWREEKGKDLIVDIDSSDLQLHAFNADTFPPFPTSYTTLEKLKKTKPKETPSIPNSLTI